jgi:hypothetical protein
MAAPADVRRKKCAALLTILIIDCLQTMFSLVNTGTGFAFQRQVGTATPPAPFTA